MSTFRKIFIALLIANAVFFLCLSGAAFAATEGRANLNPRLVRLNDPFTVDIRIISDEEIQVMAPAFPTPNGVALGNRGSTQQLVISAGVSTRTYNYTAVYITHVAGNIQLGPFRVTYIDADGVTQELLLDAVTVEIYDDAPRPSSEIVPGVSRGWIKWLIIFSVLALLAGLIYALFRMYNKKPGAVPAAVVGRQISYEEQILEELRALQLPPADDIEAVKEYYDQVDEILRKYIAKRYDVSTHDCTLWEIRSEFVKRQRIDSKAKGVFEIINDCDWVKFAKTRPSESDIRDVVRRCSDVLRGQS